MDKHIKKLLKKAFLKGIAYNKTLMAHSNDVNHDFILKLFPIDKGALVKMKLMDCILANKTSNFSEFVGEKCVRCKGFPTKICSEEGCDKVFCDKCSHLYGETINICPDCYSEYEIYRTGW